MYTARREGVKGAVSVAACHARPLTAGRRPQARQRGDLLNGLRQNLKQKLARKADLAMMRGAPQASASPSENGNGSPSAAASPSGLMTA